MTEAQLDALGPALVGFLDAFAPHCRYAPTFAHLRTYARGLLSDLPRKTAEPIALAAGTPARTVQEFLRDHLWSEAEVRNIVQARVGRLLSTLPDDGVGVVGLVDETSALKKGEKTPGVSRQYLGCVGKVGDGVVTVHLGVCKGAYKTLVDADLYLPETWSADRPRCRAAGLPDEVVHRPKWQIALDQLDRARGNGVCPDWLTFDSEYGKAPAFARGLDDRRQRFVGEVPPTFACRVGAARPDDGLAGHRADEVVRRAGAFRSQPWQIVRVSRATAEDQVWRVKVARVWASGAGGWSAGTYGLVWASSDQTGEEKFLLSNAPVEVGVETLVRVAFRRANVEHAFRVCKSELGFTHFEGRNYGALMRHLGLCVAMLAFVAESTHRLRGEKPTGDGRTGVPGIGPPEPGMAGPGAGNRRPGVGVVGHRLPSGPQPGGDRVQTETRRSTSYAQEAEKMEDETIEKTHC